MKMDANDRTASAPHIGKKEGTRSLMLDVVVALLPALGVSIYFFGLRALAVPLSSILFCVGLEALLLRIRRQPLWILTDCSAIVTGLLLGFCLPVATPYWMVFVGAFFAIVIIKQLYGGLGRNFLNPALAARTFLLSFPVIMTTWAAPLERLPILGDFDVVTAATPMHWLHNGSLPPDITLRQLLVGQAGGCLGEVSGLLLILGGVYLLVRRTISPRIPVAFLGTVMLLTYLFPRGNAPLEWMFYNLLSGGLLLGAFFLATDPVTSPVTKNGQWLFGLGCGALTVCLRYFGIYPEGVGFAILFMNVCAGLLDRWTRPRRYGVSAFRSDKTEVGQ